MGVGQKQRRWLMCGSFSAAPDGRKRAVSGEKFTTVMRDVGVRVGVSLPASLGDGLREPPELEFDRPRTFRIEEVITAVAPLKELWALAAQLDQERNIAPSVVAARIRKLVGNGGLAERLLSSDDLPKSKTDLPPVPEPPEAPTPEPAVETPPPSGSPIDAIFSKVESSVTSASKKSPLDAFIGAMRSDNPQSPRVDPRVAVGLASRIREETAAAAAALLGHPTVARLESAWRGLRMVIAEAPGHDHLAVDLVDTDENGLLGAIAQSIDPNDPGRADAVFVGVPVTQSTLVKLAGLAAKSGVPIVVGVDESLVGEVLWDPSDGKPTEEWAALRERDGTEDLCAAANPVVIYAESVAGADRLVLGSPTWGLAGILASALGRNASFNAVLGRAGAIVAPAAHEADLGFSARQTIPTLRFASLDQQRQAAASGVVLLGSAAGSDQLLVGSTVMIKRGPTLTARLSS